jgi:hypothetical protein
MKTTAKQNIAKLPEECFAILLTNKNLIRIKAGESGFFKCDQRLPLRECERLGITMDQLADSWNTDLDVTKGQREAMEIGSMHGWEVPGANPDVYTPEGL